MQIEELEPQLGLSYLEEKPFDSFLGSTCNCLSLTDIAEQIKSSDSLPESIKSLFEPSPYHLEASTKRKEYLKYLTNVTGLRPESTGEDIAIAMQKYPEKAVAHAVLALSGITEDESHIMPLTDVHSIIDHAYELYESGQQPWFDFVVEEDIVKKNGNGLSGKKSAPLFRNCGTFADFLENVLPVIKKYQEKDPTAFLKIFPQTKNVETFNIGINHRQDGSCTWTIEWHPGAYTPREGDDGGAATFKKDKSLDKEERIVRTILEFDKDGQVVAFVKPPKDPSNQKDVPPPLQYPIDMVDLEKMFTQVTLLENHDTMMSSNDPFVLLKYVATHPGFKDLLTKFHRLHEKLGYVDLVMSGMIGPDTVFGMDIDFGTPAEFANTESYIRSHLSANYLNPRTIEEQYSELQNAPIFDERDSYNYKAIPLILNRLSEFMKITEESPKLWLPGLNAILNLFSDIWTGKHVKIYSEGARILNWPILSKREISILTSMARSQDNFYAPRRSTPVDGQSLYVHGLTMEEQKARPDLLPSEAELTQREIEVVSTHSVFLTPKWIEDVIPANIRASSSPRPQLVSPKKVSDL